MEHARSTGESNAETIPVLIVGAGVAGLSASIMLSRIGVEHLLVERRTGVHGLPKAHLISAKTMEVFRQLGIDDQVYRRGAPVEYFSRFSWMTSIAGPTPLHGREIGHAHAWGDGDDAPRYSAATPCAYTNMTQIELEPLLNNEARRCAPGRIQYGQELTTLVQDDAGVTTTVRDVRTGTERTIRADIVLGADGGRTVSRQLGVDYVGPGQLGQMMITHFSAQLHRWIKDPRQGITIFLSPDSDGHSVWRGALTKMGPGRWGTDAEDWVLHVPMPVGGIPADQSDVVNIMRAVLGIDDLAPAIHSVGTWTVGGVVAERLRVGRVLLLGDSAHRHPPTGGLGLNTAVADAQNAAWKVAQVVRGNAAVDMLQSYEQERLPVAHAVVGEALALIERQAVPIFTALPGFEQGPGGWEALEGFFADTPEAEKLREDMATVFRTTNLGGRMLGLELGQQYTGSAVVPDGTEPLPNPDPIIEYVAQTRPGHRVPHAWIDRGSERSSTIDLAVLDRFVLVTDPSARAAWLTAIAEASRNVNITVDLVTIGAGGDYTDSMQNWADLNELGEGGAVLIRPDSFVGWRTAELPDDPGTVLTQVLTSLLGTASEVLSVP